MNAMMAMMMAVCLNGSWEFSFKEDQILEDVAKPDFTAESTMIVPGCWDVCPDWYMKRGTGLYRRSFTLDREMKDAVLVVDGMGVRAKFSIDGKDLGVHSYPYARLEIPVGALAKGEHVIFAAVDNVMEWPRVKLARPYYDFYFYGGFYHGVKIVERERKVFVRTVDYAARKIAVKVDGGQWEERTLPDAKLWSPESPNLTEIVVAGRKVRFGIRQVEAKNRKIYLNGKEIFLKGFNRHESRNNEGAATSEATMIQDIQNLKALGGNFIRGAHYQQSQRFLDLCDEMGVLVWEESLGWGNGQDYTTGKNQFPPNEFLDEEWCRMQVDQTREMVRTSFNHPSVIIFAFLNEPASSKKAGKEIIDRLIKTIRSEETGRLITFACNNVNNDIANENTDIVAFNAYPGTIPMKPGTKAALKKKVSDHFNGVIERFRKLYPDKPIMISESGCGGIYGAREPLHASICTEDFQDEYLTDIMETLWANPDCVGYAIWQMNDGRTRQRFCEKSCSAIFGGSVAGCFDEMRRPKFSTATVKKFFKQK